jgi:ABC-2 type transport system permease protein
MDDTGKIPIKIRINQLYRAFMAHARLGWDLEGNWAPAWLYVIFALIPSIFGVLMLVFMFRIIMGAGSDPSYLAFLLAGSAAFLFVRLLLAGAGMVVVEDREHYKTFRYIYSSPVPFPVQIFGRVAPKTLIAIFGAILTILAGYAILNVKLNPTGIEWGIVVLSLAVAIIGMASIGWMLASFMLIIDRMGWILAEGIAGLLFLITGAIFPMSFLPAPIAAVGKAVPITYWMDIWRLAIYGKSAKLGTGLAVAELWTYFLITTLIWVVLAVIWYRIADKLARHWGKIEQETFY